MSVKEKEQGKVETKESEKKPKRKRLLMVERTNSVGNVMLRLLEYKGIDVMHAQSLAVARDLVKYIDFDAYSTNLIVPDGDPIDFIRDLRVQGEKYSRDNFKAAVITGARPNGAHERDVRLLDINWYYKPANFNKLVEFINHGTWNGDIKRKDNW